MREFSKKIVVWVIVLTSYCVIADTILAYCGRTVNGSTTRTVITTLAATIITYAVKSAWEKGQRNKFNLNERGVPRDGKKDS